MAGFYKELDESVRTKASDSKIVYIETVPPNAASLLFNLGKEPFTKVSDMTKFSGFKSPTEVSNALEWLLKHGFVETRSFRVSKRGRKGTFAALTNKSQRYLNIKGAPGKGDFEHKLYQFIIKDSCNKKGEEAKIEGKMKGNQKSNDVLVRSRDGSYISYEVTLQFENLISNIQQDLAAGVSEVVIVTRDSKDMEKAVKKVASDPSLTHYVDRLTFRTIDEFFN
jgi:predicted transcriptional regulator